MVNVLGAGEFLAPITMLLADRVSSRVARQDVNDAQVTLSLPLSIAQHYDVSIQISVCVAYSNTIGDYLTSFQTIKDVLTEAKKLFAIVQDSALNGTTFLEISMLVHSV